MSKMYLAFGEVANREYAQQAVHRLSIDVMQSLNQYLDGEAEKYEPETDNYINGQLNIMVRVEVTISHKPYKEALLTNTTEEG